jgi:hypothetical protein
LIFNTNTSLRYDLKAEIETLDGILASTLLGSRGSAFKVSTQSEQFSGLTITKSKTSVIQTSAQYKYGWRRGQSGDLVIGMV